ncbi:MAG: hypothetical protein P4L63_01825 [Candidatus Pacebacteria bacterium]|nr:hypothetical protein [Candidatus Paceibacterota bacterium]
MEKKIQKIGGYLEVDKDGFIVKKVSEDRFQKKWKPVIEETKNVYIKYFGDILNSVYIRGSVAEGLAIDEISDLDTIAIVNLPKEQINTEWRNEFNKKIITEYPFVRRVEIFVVTPERAVNKEKGTHIILKTQAVCIYGKDIFDNIPKLKPGKECAFIYKDIKNDIEKNIHSFKNEQHQDIKEYKDKCSFIMKRIIRTGFELVMEREQKYTRDLYTCYESFSKYYPEKKNEMYKTLEMAINPTDDSRIIIKLLNDWLIFLSKEIEKVL